jgi:hypothetical protein
LLGGEVDLSILRTGPKKAQFFRDEKVPPMTVPLGRSGPDLGGPLAHFIVSNSKKNSVPSWARSKNFFGQQDLRSNKVRGRAKTHRAWAGLILLGYKGRASAGTTHDYCWWVLTNVVLDPLHYVAGMTVRAAETLGIAANSREALVLLDRYY